MRLSYRWLSELVEGLPGPDEVAERLTMGGIEVEAIQRPPVDYGDRLVVAKIVTREQHPNADRLTACTVDDGSGELLSIVCGARNHRAGDFAVLARSGCKLPGGLVIKKSKLRGVESNGMLCSAAELGLESGEDGIIILEQGLVPGTEAAPLLGLDDVVFELGITPNRGDCLSVLGLARETAALCGLKLRTAAALPPRPEGPCAVGVEVRDNEGCPLYHGLVLRDVKVGPSPAWLRTRLAACRLRSINNVVDVTNLVLMERGQPLHAFDLSKLRGGRIIVRRAGEGESIRALDGRDVALRTEDLVIADAEGPVAIAGVMGGELSGVTEATTDVFLEAALFAPAAVRRTSRHHGMISDSSYRFERGIDGAGVAASALRAAQLFAEVAGARIEGGLASAGPGPKEREVVRVRTARANALLGTSLSDHDIVSTLEAIGAMPVFSDDHYAVTPPAYRNDLQREIDFIEEIARVNGYDRIASVMPAVALLPVAVPEGVRAATSLRELLRSLGMHEHVTVSFASEADNARFAGLFEDNAAVPVRNPLRAEATAMQKSALPGLLAALRANLAVQETRVDLFTIARGFAMASSEEPLQREVVAGLLAGPRPGERPGQSRPLCFADLKAVVDSVLTLLAPGQQVEFRAVSSRPEYHPRAAGEVLLGGRRVGLLGRLHPDLAEGTEITGEIYLFEVDCRETVAYRRAHPGLRPIPRFPSSERDVSLLVAADQPSAAAIRAVEEMGEDCIESISVFDEYTGAGVGGGLKALGYRLVYRAADRTLTDGEVSALHEKVVIHLTARLGATVRM